MKKIILLSIGILLLINSCSNIQKPSKVRIGTYLNNTFKADYNNQKGAENAQIIIVEFFDYNCPDCKTYNNILNQILSKHQNIEIIYKDYPKLSTISTYAAKAAIAAGIQNKYFEAHNALFSAKYKLKNEFDVLNILEKTRIDISSLTAEMETDKVNNILLNNMLEGTNQGIKYIPTVIIANTQDINNAEILIMPSKEELESKIKKLN